MRRTIIIAGLIPVCVIGCTHVKPVSPSAPVDGTVVAQTQTQTAVAGEVPSTEPPSSVAASVDHPAETPATPATPAAKTTPGPVPAKAKPRSANSSVVTLPPKQPSIASAPAPEKASAPAPLDLATLEQRLRDTHAIGVLTKLSLKNQVDDLLDQFRSFYRGEGKTTLPELRQRYNLLFLKVLSLLQDADAPLAAMISSSQEAIWGILADREKFAKI